PRRPPRRPRRRRPPVPRRVRGRPRHLTLSARTRSGTGGAAAARGFWVLLERRVHWAPRRRSQGWSPTICSNLRRCLDRVPHPRRRGRSGSRGTAAATPQRRRARGTRSVRVDLYYQQYGTVLALVVAGIVLVAAAFTINRLVRPDRKYG